ncbi:HAMP domain-containing sensor histidine kinase [Halopseudomonas pachastrellae]|nr:HAMP domain-containing sensor histidine kinase [Halopseudomonas pachastrellae]
MQYSGWQPCWSAVRAFLVSRTLQQDWLLLQLNPQLRDFAAQLVNIYEQQGPHAAQQWLETQRREDRLRAHLFDDTGSPLLPGTLPASPRFAPGPDPEPAHHGDGPRRGRPVPAGLGQRANQLLRDPVRTCTGTLEGQRAPVTLILNIILAMAVLALLSLVLSRYLTRPLRQLGSAAQALAKGRFSAGSLQQTSERRDEIGELARRFESMAEQVQSLLDSQQQLLRDVSHELRSPLARLRVGLALGSQRDLGADDPLWQRLDRECDRLDRLIDGILTLSRLDSQREPPTRFALDPLVRQVVDDSRFAAADLTLALQGQSDLKLTGWPDQLQAALDNLLRNAVRFSPPNGIIQVALTATGQGAQIIIDDQGPGVPDEWLSRLSEPFVRVPGQSADSGYGLGLTIAQRAVARHGGKLTFTRNDSGGLRATVVLPGSKTGA